MTRILRRLLGGAAAAALLLPVLSTPTATAAPPDRVVLDGLGDSYGSGVGVPPYGPCGRSASAYAVQLDGRLRIDLDDFVACAGATVPSLVAGGQLTALDAETDLVTLSIGGNDIGWSSAVLACLGGSDEVCSPTVEQVRSVVTGVLPGLLDGLYGQVRAAAPNATVVVTGYPRLFSPEYGGFLAASPAEQGLLNDGADLLNEVIATRAAAHGFTFVDVTDRFLGHGVNSPEAWILPPGDPGSFHPNAAGYEAYTAAVTSTLAPLRLR